MVGTEREMENSEEMVAKKSKETVTAKPEDVGIECSKEVGRKVKNKKDVDKSPTGSGAAEPDARPNAKMSKSAIMKYCFIPDTLLSEFEGEYDLDTRLVLTEKLILVLDYRPYSTRRAQGQSSPAHELFSRSDMENAFRLMGTDMALGTHRQTFSSDLVFCHWSRSLRAAKGNLADAKGELARKKESVLEPSKAEDQALMYLKSHRVHSRDPHRRDLFHATVSETEIHF